jgi:hypothetical protein
MDGVNPPATIALVFDDPAPPNLTLLVKLAKSKLLPVDAKLTAVIILLELGVPPAANPRAPGVGSPALARFGVAV